ncbi:MAG: hypothetical protein Q8O26_11470 [Phreatobacter sp.]|uniref:hypothetical protein n=1 Tax=Phreatobacter sp. TaxID=1966341 RepID=UPI0027326051|nr:hypothetical protein [Phreatobacter sp.]MDP2802490.1 hypothetical protein [Phreatobacter sp.]
MWPFGKKKPPTSPAEALVFKSGEAFFEYQCKFGHTTLEKDKGIVGLILDARRHFGTQIAVKLQDDRQVAAVRVASDDGGFVVLAQTPNNGDPLQPGDLVVWVPQTYMSELGNALPDKRAGWVGLILYKIAPELGSELRVLSRYF